MFVWEKYCPGHFGWQKNKSTPSYQEWWRQFWVLVTLWKSSRLRGCRGRCPLWCNWKDNVKIWLGEIFLLFCQSIKKYCLKKIKFENFPYLFRKLLEIEILFGRFFYITCEKKLARFSYCHFSLSITHSHTFFGFFFTTRWLVDDDISEPQDYQHKELGESIYFCIK